MTYRQVRRSTVSNNLTDRITSLLRQDIVSGKHAYDYLTSYDRTDQPNPVSGVPGLSLIHI